MMKPCQIGYWILLHILWKCEKTFGCYAKVCKKFKALVRKYVQRFPKCYYAEEPDTPWDPIP